MFTILRDRVLRIVEVRDRSMRARDQAKSQSERPAVFDSDSRLSKKVKETHQSQRGVLGFSQQSSALVTLSGSSTRRMVPFWQVCKRSHRGVC